MTIRTIIALAGRAGAGKDTAAALLREPILADGYGITVTGFASQLKAALTTIFGFPFDDLTRDEKEAKLEFIGKSPRELMQTLGTEWGRSVHPDLWITLLERRLFDHPLMHLGGDDVVILTDCRFANEVSWVRRRGGAVWWVERTGIATVAAHSSENAIGPGDCDRTILNLGSKEQLAADLQRAWAQHEAGLEVEA